MSIIVDTSEGNSTPPNLLVSWVVSHVDKWEEYRDQNFLKLWDEYYRLWRGVWSEEDKTRESERSRLIAPALQQAVETAVAEQEEATFGRGRWIDASDDLDDQQREDISPMISRLIDDFDLAGVPAVVSETYLLGGLYGTGIGKIVVDNKTLTKPQAYTLPGMGTQASVEESQQVVVRLVAIDPREFAIDPAARSIDDGLGCAHVTLVPRHSIIAKQRSGIYQGETIGEYSPDSHFSRDGESGLSSVDGTVKLIEYHGLVPKSYLFEDDDADEDDLVEAIVTIGNDSVLLRAVENPFLMKDRSFVAYPHDKVPNRFHGRGICEKGYNPQKQLDAELRARVDALGFSVHPMMGMDGSRMPRGSKLEVKPGRSILTTGDPREILFPIHFPAPDGQTYRQAADMERMVQMGTGSMDSASPTGVSPRNNTASGMSMMLAGALKRSKRTMQNIERYFLRPLVEKAAWRYMQFAPERYPVKDFKFVVRSAMGIMAREVEQQLMVNLLSTTPPESPAYWVILKAIFENSSVAIREEVLVLLDMQLQNAINPKPPEPDSNAQALQARVQLDAKVHQDKMLLEVEKLKLESRKLEQQEKGVMIQYITAQSALQDAEAERRLTASAAMLNETKAQVDVFDAQLAARKLEVETSLKASDQKFEQMKGSLERFDKIYEQISKASSELTTRSVQENKSQGDNSQALAQMSKQLQNVLGRMDKAQPPSVDLSPLQAQLGAVESRLGDAVGRLGQMEKSLAKPNEPKAKSPKIQRNAQGQVVSVNGTPVERDEQGLIVGLVDE